MGRKRDELMDEVGELLYNIERHLAGIDPKYYTKEMIADKIRHFNQANERVTNVIL